MEIGKILYCVANMVMLLGLVGLMKLFMPLKLLQVQVLV